MPHEVFISYSAADREVADAVCATLESSGISCWMAPRDITAGMPYAAALVEAIDASRVFVLVYSAAANAAGAVLNEVNRACGAGLVIIPLRIEDAPMTKQMEFYLGPHQWLDAISRPIEPHLEHLAQAVRRHLARTTTHEVEETSTPQPQIYLSFAQEDEDYAMTLWGALLRGGAEVRHAELTFPPGLDRGQRGYEAIYESDSFVAVVSSAYGSSRRCQDDYMYLKHELVGLGPRKKMLVLRMGAAVVPDHLRDAAWIQSGATAADDAARLLSALTSPGSLEVGDRTLGGDGPRRFEPKDLTDPARCTTEELMALGEGQRIALRAGVRLSAPRKAGDGARPAAFLTCIAGMMNADGGALLLGVDPAGRVVGLDATYRAHDTDRDGFERWLREQIQRAFGLGNSLVSLRIELVRGRDVCRLDVRQSPGPVGLYGGGKLLFYIRVGPTTQLLGPRDAEKYIQRHF